MKNKWPVKKLGEVADIRIGGTPKRDNPAYWGGNNAWGTISELNGKAINDTKEHITDLGVEKSNVKLIPAGTTLMSFKLSLGKMGIAGTDLYTNEAIAALIPKEQQVLDRWLFYVSPKINFNKYLSGAAKGKTLNKASLEILPIPVPSVNVQKKIVEKLDAIRKAQELIDLQIQKTEELFEGILYKEFSLQKDSKKLADVADIIMGQSPPSSTYNLKDEGLPFFQGKAEFGDIYPAIYKFCSVPNRIAEKGDILLSVRAPVGPINIASVKCCIGRGLSAIRAKKGVSQQYLYFFMRFNEKILSQKGFGSTFSAINRKDIENIELPLGSIQKQKKTVEKLDAIQDYKKLLQRQKELYKELFDSVLDKSMKGEMDN